MDKTTWAIRGYGMEELHSGHTPQRHINLQRLPVQCCSRIQMAGSIILVDSLGSSINWKCGNGTVLIGCNCFQPRFHLHAAPRQLPPIVSRVRWSCSAVLRTLIRSIPGHTTERHGLCSRRALNFHGCTEPAPLTILC